MPDESGRVTKNKLVQLPGGSTVLVPVITQISFVDSAQQAQEWQFTVDNSGAADRDVHVAWVGDGSPNATENADPGASLPNDVLPVERIDIWRVIDAPDRGQETDHAPDNKTFDPGGPPYFTTHQKTHVVRYLNTPDDGNWIESELIDEIAVIDPVERAQESQYTLNNSPGIDDGQGHLIVQADPGAPNITDAGNGVDAPWRLDPFQNIVRVGAGYLLLVKFTWLDLQVQDGTTGPPTINTIPSDVSVTAMVPDGVSVLFDSKTTSGGEYFQTFVFDMKGVPSDSPLAISFAITGQDAYTAYSVETSGPLTAAPGVTGGNLFPINSGPWVKTQTALYSKSSYYFDATDPSNPVLPNNPTHPAGFAVNVTFGVQNTITVPSTDHWYYQAFGGPSSAFALVTGGEYTAIGLFSEGVTGGDNLELSLQNLLLTMPDGTKKRTLSMWPSAPVMRQVPWGGDPPGAAPGGHTVTGAGGYVYWRPNPPADYNFGIYVTSAIDGNFQFGGPPITSNKYTGTYPPA